MSYNWGRFTQADEKHSDMFFQRERFSWYPASADVV